MRPHEASLVLAFSPSTHGYAFVLFEGSASPVDWGVHEIRGRAEKNRKTIEALRKLIALYHPETLVLEDTRDQESRRHSRIKRLQSRLRHLAHSAGIDVKLYGRSAVRAAFLSTGAVTKHEIAEAIAEMITAFAHRLPRKRKLWMSEDPKQSLFDAAALGLTYYAELGEEAEAPAVTETCRS